MARLHYRCPCCGRQTPQEWFTPEEEYGLDARVQYLGGHCGIEWSEAEPLDTHQATWLRFVVERAAERLNEAAGRPDEPRARCPGHERHPRRKNCPHASCPACDQCCVCGRKVLLPDGAGEVPNRSPGCPECR